MPPVKKIKALVKLQIPAGKANPAPPIGPALGQHGLNIAEFCQKFNAATQGRDEVTPVELTVYEDRTYSMVLKTPPASELIKKAAGIPKGSGKPLTEKVGKITMAQVREIAEKKMPDLNAKNIEGAMSSIMGTARQMGVEIKD
ncbi:50S ribosomal protein L11 [Candidatus Uhrbacteria bacterium]|nr:50S ribosomal protein L11 [Candidatus Uhrbacteria bacterium]